jgi:hypothetical protein
MQSMYGQQFLCVLLDETKKIMLDENNMTRFDRVVGRAAGWVFWAVIGGISLMLKLFYVAPNRFFRTGDAKKVVLIAATNPTELEIQQRISS